MKVVLITQDFFPLKGGIATYLMQIYKKYLVNTDFEIIIPDSIGNKKELKKLPFNYHLVKLYPFDFKSNKRTFSNNKIMSILKRIKPDIILFGYIRSHPEIGILYKKYNPDVKWGIFIHAKEAFMNIVKINNFYKKNHRGYTLQELKFYKKMLFSADYVFTVSNFSKQLLLKQDIKRDIETLYPSINKSRLLVNAKDKLGLKNKTILLSVGRLIKRKNHANIIKLMPSLIKRFHNLNYLIVGNGKEEKKLRLLIKKYNLKKFVKIYTKIENKNLPNFYSACDIFVLPCKFIKPNDTEGFGIVFLEAGSYGKPVIGSNIGGIPEAIVNGKTGYLVKPNSLRDLYNKISKLLKNDHLREKMGKNAIKRIATHFNEERASFLIRKFKKGTSR